VKAKLQATWASGDYAIVGTTLSIVGESLCEALDLPSEARVLDVACGNGNAAVAAARRFCRVTGVDYVPALLERGRERARAERLEIDFVQGDAEALPFPDESFDVALSTYGVMFAANQERAASELLRVVRRGGNIGLANWTPEGFVGQMLKAVGRRVPPPAGVASPVYWGALTRLEELFRGARTVRARRREFVFRYRSADHFIDVFRRYYGPVYKAFGALDTAGQEALTNDLHELISDFGRAAGGSVAIPSEYLEVVIER
jgi:ubiquinone/menaquinone biosynthesis C-methylase UbiE